MSTAAGDCFIFSFPFRICKDALHYFMSLESSSHRDAWTSLLLLLLNRLLKLDDERVRRKKKQLLNEKKKQFLSLSIDEARRCDVLLWRLGTSLL